MISSRELDLDPRGGQFFGRGQEIAPVDSHERGHDGRGGGRLVLTHLIADEDQEHEGVERHSWIYQGSHLDVSWRSDIGRTKFRHDVELLHRR